MTWTTFIVLILVVIWVLLEKPITPKIANTIWIILSLTLPTIFLTISAIMIVSGNTSLTVIDNRMFNIAIFITLIFRITLLITYSITKLYRKEVLQSFPHNY